MNINKILAIDFGTTNTYLTLCPVDQMNKTPLFFDQKTPGIDTAILYSTRTEVPPDTFPIIGQHATTAYGQCPKEMIRQYGYRYESHFKPDIVNSETARQSTVDFLQCMLRNIEKTNKFFHLKTELQNTPPSCQVIVGIPSEATEEFRATLKTLFRQSGYGEIELIHEPKGALLYDMGQGIYPISKILSGYLVVDFGGGTCDFAFLQNGEVKHHWGNMHLGGRLFDDLFYQWFCDQKPGRQQYLEENGHDFYVRTALCRNAKEEFSKMINQNIPLLYNFRIGDYGFLENPTKEEFLERARHYRPSSSFLRFLENAKIPCPERLNHETDLIAWFREELHHGLNIKGISNKNVHFLSLAGGSSLWFFVKEYCLDAFPSAVHANCLNPYAAISEGLAILPALQLKFEKIRQEILQTKTDFLQKEIRAHLQAGFKSACTEAVDEITSLLYHKKFMPIFEDFRKNGGTIISLEQKMEQEIIANKDALKKIVITAFTRYFDNLYETSLYKIRNWLKNQGIEMGESQLQGNLSRQDIQLTPVQPVNATFFMDAINGIITVITTTIVGSICGGTGMALITSGPVGIIIGVALTLGVALPAYFLYGREKSTSWIKENFVISSRFSKWILSQKRIASCEETMKKQLFQKVNEESQKEIQNLEVILEKLIDSEVQQLGAANIY
ncbi:MAG: rod shape-determining protein [Planctomycetia bacterium]|nr:rod shape-determining protein [Planctomycetia bacterium]